MPMASFEIRGKVAPCTVFRPLTPLLDEMFAEVEQRLGQTPDFFRNMAVIVDLGGLGADQIHLDLKNLITMLRDKGLMPVGLQGGNESQNQCAAELHLGIFPQSKPAVRRTQVEQAPAPCVEHQEHQSMLVEKPVRSGQQIYARGRDLVVLAPVGPGAEVIADGNVHIYAPLRGRALAGVMGDDTARIFCKELRADLVSVSGIYQVSEDIPESMRGQSVQIRLDGQHLLFERL